MLDHLKDALEFAFAPKNRLKRYTKDLYPNTQLTVNCVACPWNNYTSFDTCRVIDEAFLTSETYPNFWVDIIFTEDGLIYHSLINGKIAKS
jgi:hypothetical protein